MKISPKSEARSPKPRAQALSGVTCGPTISAIPPRRLGRLPTKESVWVAPAACCLRALEQSLLYVQLKSSMIVPQRKHETSKFKLTVSESLMRSKYLCIESSIRLPAASSKSHTKRRVILSVRAFAPLHFNAVHV